MLMKGLYSSKGTFRNFRISPARRLGGADRNMSGKKKGEGSGNEFGDIEDSFFASGDDTGFWDDDTVSAYEESAVFQKKEMQCI